ncbi:N-acetylmuramoyl-L-alanine amidase [Pelagicoccus enzymogenes]|uniref:N-acetylmuramoyl-L-alanine amidase family protein n=1 Tax=Pelagicoccus enzymogenes TaxID=2773457 RepID=UPI00280F0721|nr:N-acetylmuramoyl-L-alanine amidase [Pelagicoccus enzymogenes]MDQ8198844.1 N-acetylmuramoyl-L-alanine amidase [Pelagicoccus enzymogenes]
MRSLLLSWLLWFPVSVFSASDPVDALRSQRNWEELEAFHGAVSRSFFENAMERIYAPTAQWRKWMRVEESGVWIETGELPGEQGFFLRFGEGSPVVSPSTGSGLRGLRIVLDPGHIGGTWGPLEERSFAIGDGPVVQEGDLTLAIARRLAARLREQGAEVLLTREAAEPATPLRSKDFWEEARAKWAQDEVRVAALAERFFYRTAEIRARARLIEAWGGADLALALHINASGFADPEKPALHERNDAHVLINGCYLDSELASPAQRLELLLRLLQGYHVEEERLGRGMVDSIRAATGLPAYQYAAGNACPIDAEQYLWSRNLLANRIYDCPVLYLEPWQANSKGVYEWAAAGDYEGLREFHGELRPSLPATYCDFVLAGLEKGFSVEP